ncbi:MAG: MraY family glycosyltransferase [Oscillospiraceae bacterium]
MFLSTALWLRVLLAIAVGFAVSFATTPIVKSFAQKVGAIDVPTELRRVHDHPIPRMGGLAIFLGFLISVLLFVDITRQMRGILLGAVVIVACGAIDDVISIRAWIKLLVQIAAAVIAVLHGVVIEVLRSPNLLNQEQALILGALAIPFTILWIVGITNSVNLIDGLDGLAVGVSTIASLTMFVVALLVSEGNVALILAALMGACVGFMPYNLNPAKIFMGDTGALLLGYVLATVSVVGMFKFYAVVTFVVPLFALALPLVDTSWAFFRRLLHGQNPMKPDRGHIHHRLIDMGLTQKQAVAILYSVSAVLGLCAVVLATNGIVRILLLVFTLIASAIMGLYILKTLKGHEYHPPVDPAQEEKNGKA